MAVAGRSAARRASQGDARLRLLAAPLRRRAVRDRANPHRRERDDGDCGRHACGLPRPRHRRGPDPPAAVRPRHVDAAWLRLPGDRAPEAGRHDSGRRRRHRPHGADLDEQLAGRQGRQSSRLRSVSHHAGTPISAGGGRRQRGRRALDRHGDDRHRPARGLRECRDAAARASRGTAAGAGGARVAGCGPRPHRPRSAAREPAAGTDQRRGRRGAGLWQLACPRGDGPRQPATPQRNLTGRAKPCLRARDL